MDTKFDLSVIPTGDPQKALFFCQELKKMFFDNETSVSDPCSVSVVIPVYNEEENIPILYNRLSVVLSKNEPEYEIIFIDDGSTDRSVDVLADISTKDHRVSVIELARNFGHQIAISAGLDFVRGDAVIIMDADLQDPPEVLPQFISKLREGFDVVYAIRERRKENWMKRASYAFFYRLLRKIASVEIPLDAGDFCIMDRRVVDELKKMPERNRFVRGIRSWVGLNQVGLAYERDARNAGKTKYNFTRLLYLALDGLISFSYLPLRIISILGFAVSGISILFAVGYTIQKFTIGLSPPGFATTVVAILFLAGIQLVTIGVIGEYVGRIFEEVKQRPLYIVKRIIRSN
jgi:dolichol-phosphate mannosyltransferase